MTQFKTISDFLVTNFTLILLFVFFVAAAFFLGMFITRLKMNSLIKKEREDAVNRSRAVLGGLAVEQISPFLPNFPCNPADCRFVGKPVDFIAFPGAGEGEEITDILLIEVKTGTSTLSKREREIKRAVEEGRVHYIEYRT